MKDCDKYKKKFYVGCFVIFLMVLLKVIDQHTINTVGLGIIIVIVLVLFILGLYLALPYVKCLSDNNKRRP